MSSDRDLIADLAERVERMADAGTEDFTELADILGMSLQTDFLGADLSDLSLTAQKFIGCDFTGTDFTNCDLSRSSFEGCTLVGARFRSARLGWAVLKGCDLQDADCTDAVFEGAAIQDCQFLGADLTGAFFPKSALHKCVFSGATLTGAAFHKAALSDVSLIGAALDKVRFEDCALRDVWGYNDQVEEAPSSSQVRLEFNNFLRAAGAERERSDERLLKCLSLLRERPDAFAVPMGALDRLVKIALKWRHQRIAEMALDEAPALISRSETPLEAVAGWIFLAKRSRAIPNPALSSHALHTGLRLADELGFDLPAHMRIDLADELIKGEADYHEAHRLLDMASEQFNDGWDLSPAKMRLIIRAVACYRSISAETEAQHLLAWAQNQRIDFLDPPAWVPVLNRFIDTLLEMGAGTQVTIELLETSLASSSRTLSWLASERTRLAMQMLRCGLRDLALREIKGVREHLPAVTAFISGRDSHLIRDAFERCERELGTPDCDLKSAANLLKQLIPVVAKPRRIGPVQKSRIVKHLQPLSRQRALPLDD